MADTVTKTVKVPASKAEDWDNYVEENVEVDSVSHLIRLSVQREIDGKNTQAQPSSDGSDASVSGEVLTQLQGIQTGLGDIEERLTALEEVEEAGASYDLKKAVYQILPKDTDLSFAGAGVVDEIPEVDNPDELGVLTPQEVAQKLGADVSDVEDTLKELAETTGQVQRSDVNHDGNHYWRKGQ